MAAKKIAKKKTTKTTVAPVVITLNITDPSFTKTDAYNIIENIRYDYTGVTGSINLPARAAASIPIK